MTKAAILNGIVTIKTGYSSRFKKLASGIENFSATYLKKLRIKNDIYAMYTKTVNDKDVNRNVYRGREPPTLNDSDAFILKAWISLDNIVEPTSQSLGKSPTS
ncbi:hypothetical protein MesoLj131b_46360 [Mesorhizobium sp. 131-2-5]|nr:hypothetical protein MesoLj131b_46360 [Mesorhizobium sp. 131-2-5]